MNFFRNIFNCQWVESVAVEGQATYVIGLLPVNVRKKKSSGGCEAGPE